MSAGDELGAVEEWLASTLGDDTELEDRVLAAGGPADWLHSVLAPPELDQYPFIVFQHQGGPTGGGSSDLSAGRDINNAGPGRVAVVSEWVVKAVGDGISTLPLRPIVERMGALLDDASGSSSSGLVLGAKRTGPVSYVTPELGRMFRHYGGRYRIWSTAEEA